MCDLDTPLNGLLLHSDALCILRNHLDDDPQWSGGDEQEKVQDDGEDDQEKIQEDGQEEEQEGKEETGRLSWFCHGRCYRVVT